MRVSEINELVQTGAALVAIVGIFLLGYELQQANRIAVVAANQQRTADKQDLSRMLATSESLAEAIVKFDSEGRESLSEIEFLKVRSYYDLVLTGMQGQYYQYKQGFLDREVVDKTLEDLLTQGIYLKWQKLGLLENIENREWLSEIREHVIPNL